MVVDRANIFKCTARNHFISGCVIISAFSIYFYWDIIGCQEWIVGTRAFSLIPATIEHFGSKRLTYKINDLRSILIKIAPLSILFQSSYTTAEIHTAIFIFAWNNQLSIFCNAVFWRCFIEKCDIS